MSDKIYIYAPEAAFVEPYIKHVLPGITVCTSFTVPEFEQGNGGGIAVMLSSADVYAPPVDMCDENAPVNPNSVWTAREDSFRNACSKADVCALILRCADIVCTGMQGFPKTLAEAIWRGTFFHFPGNEARRSVVHAIDVAEAIRKAAVGGLPPTSGKCAVYNICDGANPTIHDLAEALAFRMKNKRISTLSTKPQQRFAKILYGRRLYGLYTGTCTICADAIMRDMAFEPTDVCGYLRTHSYDEDSL